MYTYIDVCECVRASCVCACVCAWCVCLCVCMWLCAKCALLACATVPRRDCAKALEQRLPVRKRRCSLSARRTARVYSSLGRSLLPLWYLPALTEVHRPLFENFAKFTAVEKMSSKMFSGQYPFSPLNAATCRRPVATTACSTEPPGEPLPRRLGAAVVSVVGGPRDMDMAC